MQKILDAASTNDTDEIVVLRRRHQELERKLAVLDGHLYLSAAEQAERARLKKEKLLVKDRMLALAHH